MSSTTSSDLKNGLEGFAESVVSHEEEILRCLTSQCTLHSARIEIQQALDLSADLRRLALRSPIASATSNVFSFLPRNNLLYSLALYTLIPAALGYTTAVRAPASLRQTVRALWDLTGFDRVSRAHLQLDSQREFTEQFGRDDIILFTGQSSNGKNIDAATQHRLFLGFGSSHNPVVIMPGAPIGKVVEDLIFARMFNAGADCLAPDIIFVHRSVVQLLQSALVARLETLPVLHQSFADEIAHSNSPDSATADRARHLLEQHQDRLVWRSPRSDLINYVPTSVLQTSVTEPIISEMFAPIFNIVEFDTPQDLSDLLRTPDFLGSAMYLSLYGEALPVIPPEYVLCNNSSPFEAESALSPFGGYGEAATWRTQSGITTGQPISVFHELGGVA